MKVDKMIKQIFNFGIVGVIAFIIDYGLLYILVSLMELHYLIAGSISFTASVIFNYIASMKFVFKSRDDISKTREFIIFIVLSVIGLIINQIVMWICVDEMSIYYMISKIFATAIVLVWNFTSRKIFLEKKNE